MGGVCAWRKVAYLWGAPVGKEPFVHKWRSRLANGLMRSEVIPTFAQNDAVWQTVCRPLSGLPTQFSDWLCVEPA